MTNIESLGTDYTVADKNGKIIKVIQLILYTEILDAILGPYDEAKFGNMSNYMAKSLEVLEGFDGGSPYTTLWHATSEHEVVLPEIIEHAIKHGYERIILEYLEDLE